MFKRKKIRIKNQKNHPKTSTLPNNLQNRDCEKKNLLAKVAPKFVVSFFLACMVLYNSHQTTPYIDESLLNLTSFAYGCFLVLFNFNGSPNTQLFAKFANCVNNQFSHPFLNYKKCNYCLFKGGHLLTMWVFSAQAIDCLDIQEKFLNILFLNRGFYIYIYNFKNFNWNQFYGVGQEGKQKFLVIIHKKLAKFGYKLERKVEKFKNLVICWQNVDLIV